MHKQLDNILNKEMTRQEFITTVGVGLLSLFGFSSILKLLAGHKTTTRTQQVGAGYGSSAYGGSKKS